jgi:2-phosphoglycerate kinase
VRTGTQGERPKVLLIGGVSHLGKSTMAQRLAAELGWRYLSTDQLARHPGRPWRNDGSSLPADVIDHYSQLSTAQLVESVLAHYQNNVWPIIEAIVRSHVNNPYDPSLVLEGSAIWPEAVAAAAFDRVGFVCLSASDAFIRKRIHDSSGFENKPSDEQSLIRSFVDRTLALSEATKGAVRDVGVPSVDVEEPHAYQDLINVSSQLLS